MLLQKIKRSIRKKENNLLNLFKSYLYYLKKMQNKNVIKHSDIEQKKKLSQFCYRSFNYYYHIRRGRFAFTHTKMVCSAWIY